MSSRGAFLALPQETEPGETSQVLFSLIFTALFTPVGARASARIASTGILYPELLASMTGFHRRTMRQPLRSWNHLGLR
jgi:hypothetical protein